MQSDTPAPTQVHLWRQWTRSIVGESRGAYALRWARPRLGATRMMGMCYVTSIYLRIARFRPVGALGAAQAALWPAARLMVSDFLPSNVPDSDLNCQWAGAGLGPRPRAPVAHMGKGNMQRGRQRRVTQADAAFREPPRQPAAVDRQPELELHSAAAASCPLFSVRQAGGRARPEIPHAASSEKRCFPDEAAAPCATVEHSSFRRPRSALGHAQRDSAAIPTRAQR